MNNNIVFSHTINEVTHDIVILAIHCCLSREIVAISLYLERTFILQLVNVLLHYILRTCVCAKLIVYYY